MINRNAIWTMAYVLSAFLMALMLTMGPVLLAFVPALSAAIVGDWFIAAGLTFVLCFAGTEYTDRMEC